MLWWCSVIRRLFYLFYNDLVVDVGHKSPVIVVFAIVMMMQLIDLQSTKHSDRLPSFKGKPCSRGEVYGRLCFYLSISSTLIVALTVGVLLFSAE